MRKPILFTLVVFYFGITAFSQNKEFWGMTSFGGENNRGVIFKTDGQGNNLVVQHSFSAESNHLGSNPARVHLVEASNGMLYGMTYTGGMNNYGTLFQYNPITDITSKKLDFKGESDGAYPFGSLVEANDGKLYGMTSAGGLNNDGTLFQYNPVTNVYTKKIDFDSKLNGSYPLSSLMLADDGKLYGMTVRGGVKDNGVLFQYDPTTNILVKKIDFERIVNGAYPNGFLVQAGNGKLYGMTPSGGKNDNGILFEYDINTTFLTKKIDFYEEIRGGNPLGSLTKANDGKLYGLTSNGGNSFYGTIFQYNPITNLLVKKIDFSSEKGFNPQGSLILAKDGRLYGMTSQGGTNDMGTLFQYNFLRDEFMKKFDFVGLNGSNPLGTLVQSKDGKIYGITYNGGINGVGVLFQFDPISNSYFKKLDFMGDVNGAAPFGSLVQANDGKFYGMTATGGTKNLGVLFQYDPTTSNYNKKVDFDGTNGARPYGSLVRANDGSLYGLTYSGGTENLGVLFQYDPVKDAYSKKVDFQGVENGRNPDGSLFLATDGKFYGVTLSGGTNGVGVLFQYDPKTNVYNKKLDFSLSLGANPKQSLVQVGDNLFGLTTFGGTKNLGTLFQYNFSTNAFMNNFYFDDSMINGYIPVGSLLQSTDGKLYGLTESGGVNGMGVLFQYDLSSNLFVKKLDFSDVTGTFPAGSLMQASDGKLYGMTSGGGANKYGVLFQYNPATNSYAKKADFSGTNGAYPKSALIEVSNVYTLIQENTAAKLTIFPNPVESVFEIKGIDGDINGYQFFDLTGRVVDGALHKQEESYLAKVQHFLQGIYILRIQAGDKVQQIKFIKTK